jgi:hypothetical protein
MHKSHRAELNRKVQKRVLVDYGSKIRVIDGAIEILNAFSLAGVRLAICSSGPLQAIESSLRATELIEVIVSSDTLTCGKPHPLPIYLPWNVYVWMQNTPLFLKIQSLDWFLQPQQAFQRSLWVKMLRTLIFQKRYASTPF